MAATPYDVAEAFCKGQHKRRGNFVSTGTDLYSYGLRIASWSVSGHPEWTVDPVRARQISLTTARHVNALLYVLPYKGA